MRSTCNFVYFMIYYIRLIILCQVKPRLGDGFFDGEYALYAMIERLAPQVIAEERRIYKGVCANVDFYSGLVYRLLNLPNELFTPLFAMARIAGWSAHRLEELLNGNKIIRPAYRSVKDDQPYVPISKR